MASLPPSDPKQPQNDAVAAAAAESKCSVVSQAAPQPNAQALPESPLDPPRKFFRPLIISGPSGVGKGTLLQLLFKEFPDEFGFCVSHTTRKPRLGETDGVHYHFVTPEEFKKVEFLEWAEVHGNFYGTSVEALQAIRRKGRIPVLDIDIAGAKALHKFQHRLNSQFLWIDAPSLKEVEARLRGRNTETEEQIQTRLATMRRELEEVDRHSHLYDKRIVNDKLDQCFKEVKQFLHENLESSKRLHKLRAMGQGWNSNMAASHHL